MDYSMLLVSLILILIIFSPFFYAGLLGKKQTKKLKKLFDVEINKCGYAFDEKEFWNDMFIGLDVQQAKLIYMRQTHHNELVKKEIWIDSVKSCDILKDITTQTKGDKTKIKLKRVDLELRFNNQTKPKIQLNFFDSENHFAEDQEIERAEKWKALILAH